MNDKIEEAIARMTEALELLDAEGASLAAANLEHALSIARAVRTPGPVTFSPAGPNGLRRVA
jgi:hypothetical protein